MNDTKTYYQPIFHDNGTISVVAGDNTYDHTYADKPMNEAIVETSHHKPNPINWKHVVSNCDERWNLLTLPWLKPRDSCELGLLGFRRYV